MVSTMRAAWCPAAMGDENRRTSISIEPRINDRIRVPEVRLVGDGG
jgi:hypothetical protein